MAAATYEHMQPYQDEPLDADEAAYPCKGCGKILEEGKAFELAGNRWHIDCFRCNTCDTLLDSDANLLLLGDGSLICNNCTYSCSSCGNKIEDLAILTGDQAFCANCFKCRSCKRKIENLRYARTSQGIFCMDCHEALMARRRKKTARGQNQRSKNANIDKSLPAIPPPEARHTAYLSPGSDSMYNDSYEPATPEQPPVPKTVPGMRSEPESEGSQPATSTTNQNQAGLTLPSTTYRDNRRSYMSHKSELSGGGEEFLIPLAFDPNPPKQSPSMGSANNTPRGAEEKPRDYFNRSVSHGQQGSISQTSSPHIAYQDKNSKSTSEPADYVRSRHESRTGSTVTSPYVQQEQSQSPHISQLARNESEQSDRLKLQDPPKNKRVTSTSSTPRADTALSTPQPTSPLVAEPEGLSEQDRPTPRRSHDTSPNLDGTADSSKPLQNSTSKLRELPKRGDSLEGTKRQQTIPRKEVPTPLADITNSAGPSPRPANQPVDLERANGGKVISAPISSPESKGLFETPNLRQQQGDAKGDTFVEPRVPPAPPEAGHSRDGSISTAQSEANAKGSPKLPRYSAGGDFTMDEDMARILGMDEQSAHESFLRRVSNSVRHGRSYSDKSGRQSRDRWPRSPITATSAAGQEISSPSTTSPEHREELAWFKNELQRERQRNLVREKRISELEAQINSTATINQVNVELKEKRSTMVVLDTQKEIVIRELEVLTEHIAKAKKSGEPLDMGKMNSVVLRDLAEALQKLKDSFAPQIESLVQQRNDLLEEIAHLTQSKDKSFQEFEQLSNKNAQLAEFNNQLVDQIQNIYKSNRSQDLGDNKPNGLGIYSHHKEKSQVSIDVRDIRPIIQNQNVLDPVTTFEAGEAGAAQTVGGAQMVEMKKGAVAKRFDWRRGQKMAKGLTKGVKGAFTSAQQNYGREMQFAETGAYGQGPTQGGLEYSTIPKNNQEPVKQGWFKPQGKNGLYTGSGNLSTPSLLADAGAQLFGSDLEQRVEYEKTNIPGIVKRCVQEVEARGMDVEGIYRKSGGNSQVQQVKEGFEKQPADYDISDPDLDIHAVTSGLKQYFRKLPTPLITFDCYDRLIELTKIPEGPDRKALRVQGLKDALETLPKVNYETLEYLMRHLSRVVVLEKENLMTPMNVAVVFAPTIMRPESVARELSDTKAKNEVVMWMVEESDQVFD